MSSLRPPHDPARFLARQPHPGACPMSPLSSRQLFCLSNASPLAWALLLSEQLDSFSSVALQGPSAQLRPAFLYHGGSYSALRARLALRTQVDSKIPPNTFRKGAILPPELLT